MPLRPASYQSSVMQEQWFPTPGTWTSTRPWDICYTGAPMNWYNFSTPPHFLFYFYFHFSPPPPKHFSSFCSIQIFTRLLILTWNMLSVEHDNHSIAFVFQLVVSVRWCIMHRIKIYFITQIYWIITNYYMSA